VSVTGATGLTGSHTVRALLESGHEVRAFVRNPRKAETLFLEHEGALELVQGDITEPASVADALHGCDGVIHCAAVVAAGRDAAAAKLLETNVSGVRNVIGTALELGIRRIVHVSSLATLFRGDGTVLSEDSEARPSEHAYGQSKTLADAYVRKLQVAGHPIQIVYPAAIIGPDDPGLSESMMALRAFIEDFIPITTGGMQFVDARDLGVAHCRILESEPAPARYLAAGTFLRWSQLASEIEQANARPPRAIPFPAPLLRGAGRLLDLVRKVLPVRLPLTAEAAAYITRWDAVPNSAALEEMGVRFRDVSETMTDSIRWLKEAGYLS
jgi:nucleoside-diphosphate-sugar epimerase